MEIIQDKILMLAVMMVLGYAAEKSGYVRGIAASVSKAITRITLPLLVISTLSGQGFNPETARGAGITAAFALAVVIVLLISGRLCAILFRFGDKRRDVHTCLSSFGNVMFLGYPLIGGVFGDRGIFYAAFYALVNDCMLWTLGILILSRRSGGKPDFKKLVNPNTMSFVIGVGMFFAGLRLPGVMHDAASMIGSATIPLSMLFIGSTLASVSMRRVLNNLTCLSVVVLKMVIAPVFAFYILNFITGAVNMQIESMVVPIIIMQIAMPCQTVFAIVAREYDSDTEYAASCIFVTTLLSLVTLPAVYHFITRL